MYYVSYVLYLMNSYTSLLSKYYQSTVLILHMWKLRLKIFFFFLRLKILNDLSNFTLRRDSGDSKCLSHSLPMVYKALCGLASTSLCSLPHHNLHPAGMKSSSLNRPCFLLRTLFSPSLPDLILLVLLVSAQTSLPPAVFSALQVWFR